MSLQTHPKWKYGAGGASVLVADEAAEAALGAGWYDSPALVPDASTHDDSSPFIVEVSALKREAVEPHHEAKPRKGHK